MRMYVTLHTANGCSEQWCPMVSMAFGPEDKHNSTSTVILIVSGHDGSHGDVVKISYAYSEYCQTEWNICSHCEHRILCKINNNNVWSQTVFSRSNGCTYGQLKVFSMSHNEYIAPISVVGRVPWYNTLPVKTSLKPLGFSMLLLTSILTSHHWSHWRTDGMERWKHSHHHVALKTISGLCPCCSHESGRYFVRNWCFQLEWYLPISSLN